MQDHVAATRKSRTDPVRCVGHDGCGLLGLVVLSTQALVKEGCLFHFMGVGTAQCSAVGYSGFIPSKARDDLLQCLLRALLGYWACTLVAGFEDELYHIWRKNNSCS